MASLNKCFLLGNLTRDPEIRTTPRGTSVCLFGMAVTRTFKDDTGKARDETTFVDIEAWGRQAEVCGKYLKKGRPCLVEGRLKLDSWTDEKTGGKRTKLKVVLENIQFLGDRSSESSGGGGSTGGWRKPSEDSGARDINDDVPFGE